MSLEAVIAENTAALTALASLLAKFQPVPINPAEARSIDAAAEAPSVEQAKKETAPAPKAHASKASAKAKPTTSDEKIAPTEEPVDTQPTAEEPAAPEKKAERFSEVPVSYDQAKAAILSLARARGRAAAQSVLQKLNAKALPDIPSDKFHEVIDACNEALEAAEAV